MRRDLLHLTKNIFAQTMIWADRASLTATGTADGGRKAFYLCSESLWEARGDVADLI